MSKIGIGCVISELSVRKNWNEKNPQQGKEGEKKISESM